MRCDDFPHQKIKRLCDLQWVFLLLLLVSVGLLYWQGLSGGFFFDDGASILHNQKIKISHLSLEILQQVWASGIAGPTGRPISQLSFALNYFFGGLSPYGYKVFNLILHLLVTVVVFFTLKNLLDEVHDKAESSVNAWLALGVTAVWAVHPIQLTTVLHVVQRMTSLSALFLLLAFYFHVTARQAALPALSSGWRFVVAWGVFWPISILCKEAGALFPLFVLVYELTIHRRSSEKFDRFAKIFMVAQGLLLLCVLFYMLSPYANWLWSGYEMRSFDLLQRLLTEARVIWFYLRLIVLPQFADFSLFHDDFVISTGWFEPVSTAVALLGLVILIMIAWHYRIRAALLSFCIGWFLIGHLLESSFLPLEIAHEHRNYLPSLGIFLIFPVFSIWLQGKGGVARKYVFLIFLPFIAYYSFLTLLRADQYGDDWRRVQTEAAYHSESPRNVYASGAQWGQLYSANRENRFAYSAAYRDFEKASRLDANSKTALFGMIYLDCLAGLPPKNENFGALKNRLSTRPFSPGDRGDIFYFKEFLLAHPQCLTRTEVEQVFDAALKNSKLTAGVKAILLSWLADFLWLREQDWRAAKNALQTSLEYAPGVASNRLKLIQLEILSALPSDRERLRKELRSLPKSVLSAGESQTIDQLLESLSEPTKP